MNVKDLIAIDVHTHAEVSCRQPQDEVWQEYETAASRYFKAAARRPTIAETVAYYRERRIGLVMFTVDTEHEMGIRRISNQEIIDAARENSDIMIAFASIDPHKGKLGVREVWHWIDGQIQVHVLRGTRYEPVAASEALPDIDLVQLVSFLDRPTASRAIRDYRAALRARTN